MALTNLAIGLIPIGLAVAGSALISRIDPTAGRGGSPVYWATIVPGLSVMGIILLLQNTLAPFQVALGELVTQKVDGYCARKLIHTSLADASMAQLETPEILSQINDAQSGLTRYFCTPGAAAAGFPALLGRYSQMLGP